MPPLFESNSDAPIPKILRNLHLPISLYSDVGYCIALPNVAARSQTPHCALTKRIAFRNSTCNNQVSCEESGELSLCLESPLRCYGQLVRRIYRVFRSSTFANCELPRLACCK